MSLVDQKHSLRKALRQARRSLSAQQQQQASHAFVETFRQQFRTQKPKRVALYLAMDGELDLAPFIEQCRRWKVDVYLPIIHAFQPTLWFAKYEPRSQLVPNRFSIPEPLHSDPIRPWQLNQVLFPLVGFDEHGGRLGMGGGFYDRTFARADLWPKRPSMIGVAHECQKVDHIPTETWDIKLDGIISDAKWYTAK